MADKSLSPLAFGDSLAQGMRDANQLGGISRVGAGPKEVLEMLQRYAAGNSMSGRDVFLGTGMPNIPEQKKFIEQQIDFVKKQGGNPILIGVGPGTKKKPTTGQNEFLADLAKRKGLSYMGPLVEQFPDITKDPMGLHLRPKQYQQLFKQYSSQAPAKTQPEPQTQQTQPKSQPKPTQTQPQSGEPSASDLLSKFTSAILYSESRGKRYATDKKGNVIGLLTSPKGATGEMQVMPGTITDPGFGVKPARDNSPEEIARVGRDYAAVMLKRYGNDPLLAAVAYNWGPGNTDKWIKRGADFDKLPKETRKYVTSIAGRMDIPTPVLADRPSQPTPRRTEATPAPIPVSIPKRAEATTSPTPFNPVVMPLPPKREDVTPTPPFKQVRIQTPVEPAPQATSRIPEQQFRQVQAFRPVAVPGSSRAQLDAMYVPPWMAQARPVAPPPPEVVAESPAQTAPMAEVAPQVSPRPPVRAEARSDAQVALRSTPEFLRQFPVETFAPTPVKPEPVRAEPRIVAEVPPEPTVEEMPAPTSTLEEAPPSQAEAVPAPVETKVATAPEAVSEPRIEPEAEYPPMSTLEEPAPRPARQEQRQEQRPVQNVVTRADMDRLGPNYQAALAATTLADSREDDDYEDDEAIAERYMEERGLDLARQESTLEEEAPRVSPLAGLAEMSYRSPFPEVQPVGMAEGGLVYRADGSPIYGEGFDTGPITEDTRKALSNVQVLDPREALAALKRIGKEGVSNAESMARRSVATVPGFVGDVESIFRDDKSRRFATSAEVDRQYLPQRFTAPTKESEGYAAIGEFIDPTIALKAAPTTAKAALKAMKSAGPQIESMLMKAAPVAEPMYAIPRTPNRGEKLVNVDSLVSDYKTMVDNVIPQDSMKYKPLMDMLDKKAKDYFYTSYGTAKDPIRKAVKEGQIPMFDMSTFAEYADTVQKSGVSMRDLLGNARMGDKNAAAALEKLYDDMTGLRKVRDSAGREYYDLYSQFGAEFPFLSRGQLIESLSTLPVDQLQKLDFPEAVVLGTQNYLKKIDPSRGANVVFFPKKPKQ